MFKIASFLFVFALIFVGLNATKPDYDRIENGTFAWKPKNATLSPLINSDVEFYWELFSNAIPAPINPAMCGKIVYNPDLERCYKIVQTFENDSFPTDGIYFALTTEEANYNFTFLPDVTLDRNCIIQNSEQIFWLHCNKWNISMRVDRGKPDKNFRKHFGRTDVFFISETAAVNLTTLRKQYSDSNPNIDPNELKKHIMDPMNIENYCDLGIKHVNTLYKEDAKFVFHGHKIKIVADIVTYTDTITDPANPKNVTKPVYLLWDGVSGRYFYVPENMTTYKSNGADRDWNCDLSMPQVTPFDEFTNNRRYSIVPSFGQSSIEANTFSLFEFHR